MPSFLPAVITGWNRMQLVFHGLTAATARAARALSGDWGVTRQISGWASSVPPHVTRRREGGSGRRAPGGASSIFRD